jgi:hypothetical protein
LDEMNSNELLSSENEAAEIPIIIRFSSEIDS